MIEVGCIPPTVVECVRVDLLLAVVIHFGSVDAMFLRPHRLISVGNRGSCCIFIFVAGVTIEEWV